MKKQLLLCITSFMLIGATSCTSGKDKNLAYKDASLPIEQRVDDLLQRMTLDEKIAQIQHIHAYQFSDNGNLNMQKLAELVQDRGVGCVEALTLSGKECAETMHAIQSYVMKNSRLEIPVFTVTESLHGSVHDGSTIFPQSIALGSTFNPDLAYKMTEAISGELKAQGIWQSLTPVIDVVRDLRWGRVEECFSEDPLLVTEMGLSQVKGYIDNGISPMIKHFGAHANPSGGLNLASVASGQRDLLSVYLKPFEKIVKEAKPWAVMSSYNSWDNQPNSSSEYLQTELLRNQWGFEGYMYSDWGAIAMLGYFHKTAQNNADAAMQALISGLDVEASGNCYTELKELVNDGVLDEKYIDIATKRVLRAKFALGMFENPYRMTDKYDEIVHSEANIALAREIADESIILVKNDNNLLPLNTSKVRSVAVIGPNADQVQFGDYTWSRKNEDGITFLNGLKNKYGKQISIDYAKGCDLVTNNKDGFDEAVKAARKNDVSILVVGSASASLARDYSKATCGEGFDLSDLNLTGVQEDLIKAVHAVGKPVIVVLASGKPFSIPWVKENIPAILVQWYAGEQAGNSLADVVFGKVNPSGKLNYSFPQSVGHLPCYYNYLPTDKGFYKQPGTPNNPKKDYVFSSPAPLWAFGHGLSYTEFDYLSATTSKDDYGRDDEIEVTVKVRNTGNMDGKEVVQLYISDVVSSVVTPIHELKGFKKVMIAKGSTSEVKITVPVSELAIYNKDMKKVVEAGAFEIQVGRASDDIRIKKIITVDKDKELRIITMKDKATNSVGANISSINVTVTGVVRDVQANILSGILVKVKDNTVHTNELGQFSIKAMSTDTLTVGGDRYKEELIPIDGRQVINVGLLIK